MAGFRRFTFALCALFLAVNGRAQSAGSGDVAAQQKQAEAILQRLMAAPNAPKPKNAYSKPPSIQVDDSTDLRAYSEAPGCVPAITITSGLMTQIVAGSEDRAAFVIGHELSHVLLDHTTCSDSDTAATVTHQAYVRDQEFAADQEGLKLALAAGYNYAKAFSLYKSLETVAGDSPIEALTQDHPSIAERSQRLETDAAQRDLWSSMGAFADGVSLLTSEQYGLAISSFKAVTRQFPKAYDAWNNQGYAYLMLYMDKLRADDLTTMHLGRVVAGGYFREAASLSAQLRGKNIEDWNNAIAALQFAAQLQPKSALIQGNLGLAYVVAPDDKDVGQAVPLLQAAITAASADAQKLGYEVNLASAQVRTGDATAAQQTLGQLQAALAKLPDDDAVRRALQIPVQYDQWLANSNKATDAAQKDALAAYLNADLNHESAWWQTAYTVYSGLCAKVHASPQAAGDFPQMASYRRVISVDVGGATIRLGESMTAATQDLEKGGVGVTLPLGPQTPLHRVCYKTAGVDLIGDNVVVAIALTSDQAPAVPLRRAGLAAGDAAQSLRVGSGSDVLAPLMGPETGEVTISDSGPHYRWLADLGLALDVDSGGHVREIVLVGPPDYSPPAN